MQAPQAADRILPGYSHAPASGGGEGGEGAPLAFRSPRMGAVQYKYIIQYVRIYKYKIDLAPKYIINTCIVL